MILDSTILIHRDEMSRLKWGRLFRALTFTDADDNVIEAYDHLTGRDAVRIPRGALDMLPNKLVVKDFRTMPHMRKLRFTRTLDAEGFTGQYEALQAMFEHGQGQVIRQPGTGKTNIALAFASACKTPTLVIVHTARLFAQWIEEAHKAIPDATIGMIRGKLCTVGDITIAMAQTLKRYVRSGRKFWQRWGCLIVDEEHHAGAETWEWLLNVCPAYYRFGFTATEKRSDGRHPLIRLLIGPVIHRAKFKSPYPVKVLPIGSGFKSKYGGGQYSRMLRQLCADEDRNRIIAKIAVKEMARENSLVILSEQVKHLDHIYDAIQAELLRKGIASDIMWVAKMTGRVAPRRQEQIMEAFRIGTLRVVLATRIFDEGVDVPIINRVILAFPGKHETPIIQRIGRALRKNQGKTDVIVYDIVDDEVPTFNRHYQNRKRTYRKMGVKIGKAVKHGKKDGNRLFLGRRGLEEEAGRKLLARFSVRRSKGA